MSTVTQYNNKQLGPREEVEVDPTLSIVVKNILKGGRVY